MSETISDNEVNILGYDIVRRDRTIVAGEGVCFHEKKSVTFTVRNDLNMETLENLCLKIQKPGSKPFVVIRWYRPPDSSIGIFSSFEHLIGILDLENIEYYLMGDLNCDMIVTRYDNDTCKLMSITDVYGPQQLITEPTRVTLTSSILIGVIYTNFPDKMVCSGVYHVSISDHSMVFAYRKLAINGVNLGHNTLTYRKFRNFNRSNFRNDIASQNWDEINKFSNPNDTWSKWKCMFLSIVDKLRTMRVRARRCPWITSELKKRMHNRKIPRIRTIKSKDPFTGYNKKKRKKQCNIVNSEIRLAKRSYYHKSFNEYKVNSRKTW